MLAFCYVSKAECCADFGKNTIEKRYDGLALTRRGECCASFYR